MRSWPKPQARARARPACRATGSGAKTAAEGSLPSSLCAAIPALSLHVPPSGPGDGTRLDKTPHSGFRSEIGGGGGGVLSAFGANGRQAARHAVSRVTVWRRGGGGVRELPKSYEQSYESYQQVTNKLRSSYQTDTVLQAPETARSATGRASCKSGAGLAPPTDNL